MMEGIPRNTILQGDVLDRLREMPDGCVQCVVTSPPYWNLRDYGVPGQIGLEATPEEYVAKLVEVFREVRRVLRNDGTLWLNCGDCYATHAKGLTGDDKSTLDATAIAQQRKTSRHKERNNERSAPAIGLKDKDLIGLPWMLAFALRADGWYLRSDIVWSKPNPMPESVTDRPTRGHEYLFLFAKSRHYYYDADAIREPVKASSVARIQQANFANQTGGAKDFAAAGVNANRSMRRTLEHFADKQRGHSRRHAGFNDRWDAMSRDEQQANGANKRDVWTIATQPFTDWGESVRRVRVAWRDASDGTKRITSADCPLHGDRSALAATAQCDQHAGVVSPHTSHNDDRHALAPAGAPAPIVQSHDADSVDGSSDSILQPYAPSASPHSTRSRRKGRALATTAAYTASVETADHTAHTLTQPGWADSDGRTSASNIVPDGSGDHPLVQTAHHNADTSSSATPPECSCEYYDEITEKMSHFATFPTALIEPCIAAGARPGDLVLDPFMGSGTVGVVCRRMGRDYLGIELNPAYVKMAERRIAQEVQPMLLFAPRREAVTA